MFFGPLQMFQSLIGRLQTRIDEIDADQAVWFQSLIGRLQTPSLTGHLKRGGRFQSLIGRLQTERMLLGYNNVRRSFNPL